MNYKIKQSDNDVKQSVYKNRNIDDKYIDDILYSNEDNWENPSNYKDINRAYKRIMKAINNEELIYVLADNDCDGFTSCSIITMFLYEYMEYDNIYYIIHEDNNKAHGITDSIINKIKKDKVNLLITPDAGSNDIEYQKKLHELGCDFIALDHHDYKPDEIPEYSIVVNNQCKTVNNKDGSGALVTYKMCYYIAEQEGIDIGIEYLDLVNVANIADSRDMSNLENRFIYNIGNKIENITNPLLKSFIKDIGKKEILTIEDISFNVSNRINSIIRLGDTDERMNVLESIMKSSEKINYKYRGKSIEQSIQDSILRVGNRLRNKQKTMIEKCIKEGIKTYTTEDDKILIIDGSNISREITGLVANKLSNEFNKSVIILRERNGFMEGSVRSYDVINFKDLCTSSKLLNYAEGHEGAFGISILSSNIDKFIEFINDKLKDIEISNSVEVEYVYDSKILLDDVMDIGELNELWSNSIPRPKFLVKNIHISTEDIIRPSNKNFNFSFKVDDIVFKKDFCARVFYERFVCISEEENVNEFKHRDLNMDIIFEVKSTETGFNYCNIVDFDSSVAK